MRNHGLGLTLMLAAILILAGCGRGSDEEAKERVAAEDSTAGRQESVYHSREGRFEIVWPQGCSRIRIRTQPYGATETSAKLTRVQVWCDREEHEGEGASVVTYFDLKGDFGSPATPRTVIDLVKDLMKKMGVEIASQRPLKRGALEGLEVRCHEPGSTGTAWIEAFLLGSTAYIISAWRSGGDIFDDPQYIRMFDSFRATSES
jgi:hypothetical protein